MADVLPETLPPDADIAIYTDSVPDAEPFKKQVEEKYNRPVHLFSSLTKTVCGTSCQVVIIYRVNHILNFLHAVVNPFLTVPNRRLFCIESLGQKNGELLHETKPEILKSHRTARQVGKTDALMVYRDHYESNDDCEPPVEWIVKEFMSD